MVKYGTFPYFEISICLGNDLLGDKIDSDVIQDHERLGKLGALLNMVECDTSGILGFTRFLKVDTDYLRYRKAFVSLGSLRSPNLFNDFIAASKVQCHLFVEQIGSEALLGDERAELDSDGRSYLDHGALLDYQSIFQFIVKHYSCCIRGAFVIWHALQC